MILGDYIGYFRHQAEHHPLLMHSPLSGHRVFELVDFESAWGDFRSTIKEKDYMMRLALPTLGTEGEAFETTSMYGAFLIAKYWKIREIGDDDLEVALSNSLQIGLQIGAKMIADSNAGHPFFGWAGGSAEALDLRATPKMYTGDANYAGYWFTFKVAPHWDTCMTAETAPAWLDAGLTPY